VRSATVWPCSCAHACRRCALLSGSCFVTIPVSCAGLRATRAVRVFPAANSEFDLKCLSSSNRHARNTGVGHVRAGERKVEPVAPAPLMPPFPHLPPESAPGARKPRERLGAAAASGRRGHIDLAAPGRPRYTVIPRVKAARKDGSTMRWYVGLLWLAMWQGAVSPADAHNPARLRHRPEERPSGAGPRQPGPLEARVQAPRRREVRAVAPVPAVRRVSRARCLGREAKDRMPQAPGGLHRAHRRRGQHVSGAVVTVTSPTAMANRTTLRLDGRPPWRCSVSPRRARSPGLGRRPEQPRGPARGPSGGAPGVDGYGDRQSRRVHGLVRDWDLYASGPATITCAATDGAAPPNMGRDSIPVYIDLGPVITIDSPVEGAAEPVNQALRFATRSSRILSWTTIRALR